MLGKAVDFDDVGEFVRAEQHVLVAGVVTVDALELDVRFPQVRKDLPVETQTLNHASIFWSCGSRAMRKRPRTPDLQSSPRPKVLVKAVERFCG